MLNHEFIQRKIKLIQEDLSHLEPLSKYSFTELAQDSIKYDATERILERIITRAIDLNRHCLAELGKGNEIVRTHQDTFLRLADLGVYPAEFAAEIAPSAGLRNVLVHEYDQVDPRQVWESLGKALAQYAKYCEYLIKFLEKHN
ncbi:MAG: DUF86 domain-containing protein [Candidatus Magasanikbacteria bacterium]|nr:DUF86 domain-containing protein [Candidatus Magasanikbacteria bacterium]